MNPRVSRALAALIMARVARLKRGLVAFPN